MSGVMSSRSLYPMRGKKSRALTTFTPFSWANRLAASSCCVTVDLAADSASAGPLDG